MGAGGGDNGRGGERNSEGYRRGQGKRIVKGLKTTGRGEWECEMGRGRKGSRSGRGRRNGKADDSLYEV